MQACEHMFTEQYIHKHYTNYTIQKYMHRKITQCKLHAGVTRVSSELREEGFQSFICVYKLTMTVIFPRTMPS